MLFYFYNNNDIMIMTIIFICAIKVIETIYDTVSWYVFTEDEVCTNE